MQKVTKTIATTAFKSLSVLWKRKKITRINTRIQTYNTLVLPVFLYNCGTWGVSRVTEGILMEKIETYHRKQLRAYGPTGNTRGKDKGFKECRTI